MLQFCYQRRVLKTKRIYVLTLDIFYNATFEIISDRKIKTKDIVNKIEEIEEVYGVCLIHFKRNPKIFQVKKYKDFGEVEVTKKFKFKHILSYKCEIKKGRRLFCFGKDKYYKDVPVRMKYKEFHNFTEQFKKYQQFLIYKQFWECSSLTRREWEFLEYGRKLHFRNNIDYRVVKRDNLYISKNEYLKNL